MGNDIWERKLSSFVASKSRRQLTPFFQRGFVEKAKTNRSPPPPISLSPRLLARGRARSLLSQVLASDFSRLLNDCKELELILICAGLMADSTEVASVSAAGCRQTMSLCSVLPFSQKMNGAWRPTFSHSRTSRCPDTRVMRGVCVINSPPS